MVAADWNDLKPMQNVTAKGPDGTNGITCRFFAKPNKKI